MGANGRFSDDCLLYDKHGMIVDRNNKEIVMRTEISTMISEFRTKAHIMEFCTLEHFVGRVLHDGEE